MCAKHYENPTMLSKVTDKNVGDVFLRHTVVITIVISFSLSVQQRAYSMSEN